MLFCCNLFLWFSFWKTIFFPCVGEKLHIATLYIIKYFLSLFWQLLPKTQYLLTECGVTPKYQGITCQQWLLFCRYLFHPELLCSTAVCVCVHCVVKKALWNYCLSMKCMYYCLEYSGWQNKYITSHTPFLWNWVLEQRIQERLVWICCCCKKVKLFTAK